MLAYETGELDSENQENLDSLREASLKLRAMGLNSSRQNEGRLGVQTLRYKGCECMFLKYPVTPG